MFVSRKIHETWRKNMSRRLANRCVFEISLPRTISITYFLENPWLGSMKHPFWGSVFRADFPGTNLAIRVRVPGIFFVVSTPKPRMVISKKDTKPGWSNLGPMNSKCTMARHPNTWWQQWQHIAAYFGSTPELWIRVGNTDTIFIMITYLKWNNLGSE